LDVFECIKKRRSIRSYKRDPVPDDDLKKILEAGIWAPSAGNRQSWEFIIVKDRQRKVDLSYAAYEQDFIVRADTVIVVCANTERSARRYGNRGRTLYAIQDATIATQNMLLAATALGYGTCWIGAFNEEQVKKILKIPEGIRPIAIVPVGVPNESPEPPPRTPIEVVTHVEQFGNRMKDLKEE